MKNFKVLAVTAMAATITISVPVTAYAASPYCEQPQKNVADYNTISMEEVQGKLKDYGIDIDSLNSGNGSYTFKYPSTEVKQEVNNKATSQSTITNSQNTSCSPASESTAVIKPTEEELKNTEVQKEPKADYAKNTNISKLKEEVKLTYAQQVVKLVNEERVKEGLSPLTIDRKVEKAANVRAKETITSFSHTRPNGSSFSSALKEQDVSYKTCGENIAYGQTSPEDVMKAWMDSPGHRANILNENFTKMGVGYTQSANGTNYWCQLFIG